MFKKRFCLSVILILIASLCLFVSCQDGGESTDDPNSSSGSESVIGEDITITLEKTAVELFRFESAVLSATSSDGSSVVFSSDNENVATVTAEGVITAKNVGSCDIIAAAGRAEAKCKVIVRETPYVASIEGIDDISLAKGGEFKAELYVEYNGAKIADDVTYRVLSTVNTAAGVAEAKIDGEKLTVKALSAGTTELSVVANVRGSDAEKTFSVTVYENEIVIEPKNTEQFNVTEGIYLLDLTTEDGAFGLKESASLDFGILVDGAELKDFGAEWDTEADYNSDFDKKVAEVTGNTTEGFAVKANGRGNTSLVGKFTVNGKEIFVSIKIGVRIPEIKLSEIILSRNDASFKKLGDMTGDLDEIKINGVTVSKSIDGTTATLDKSLIPDNGNELISADMEVYTNKYCYKMPIKICTDILTSASDFDAFKMTDGNYKAFYGYYVLTGDIDFSSYGVCTAIRDNSNPSSGSTGFKGVLDGNGYKMKNITVGSGGIFGHIGSGAVIKNITFDNVKYNNAANSTLLAHTIRDADLQNIVLNVSAYAVTETMSGYTIKYDVGLFSSRFLIESRLTDITVNAAGINFVNLFGHRCTDNQFNGMKIYAASYKLIGCNSDAANPSTEIKELPDGITFTEKQ